MEADLRELGTKTCTKCAASKPLTEFNKKADARDGRHPLCRECHRAASREHYARNRDHLVAGKRAYYARTIEQQRAAARERGRRDPAAVAERAARWRERNPERVKELNLRWRTENRDRVVELRAMRRGAPGQTSKRDLTRLVERFRGRCAYCDGPYEQIDHVVPVSRGGTHYIGNLLPACLRCNVAKNARFLTEWRYERGRRRNAA